MITNSNIGKSNTIIFTATKQTAVTTMILCNTGATPDTISLYIVKSGGVPSNVNTILSNLQLIANDTFVCDTERIILDAGDTVRAISTTGNTQMTVSVMELASQ